jgi:hypothetical protein
MHCYRDDLRSMVLSEDVGPSDHTGITPFPCGSRSSAPCKQKRVGGQAVTAVDQRLSSW